MKLRSLSLLRIHRRHVPHICAGLFALVLLLGLAGPMLLDAPASAALLQTRSVKISDPTALAKDVNYTFGFSTNASGALGSIKIQICYNYMYQTTDTCTAPGGFDASATTLVSQTGIGDFTLDPTSTANILILARPAATPVSSLPLTLEFDHIVNPDYIGSIYAHITTYSSTDASGIQMDYGDVVTTTSDDITITTEVPPYLQFCTGITIAGFNCGTAEGGLISFGELSLSTTRAATSQMLASTNAPYGYSITLAGSTLTAGNNAIPAMTGTLSKTGVSQFGLNARFNTIPNIGVDPVGDGLTNPSTEYNTPNQYRFNSGDIIASSDHTDDYRKITVSYIVNRGKEQPPGKYVATISYICLANF
jgi:hypothetical protein